MSGKRRTDQELLEEAEANRRKLRERVAMSRDPDIKLFRRVEFIARARGIVTLPDILDEVCSAMITEAMRGLVSEETPEP